MKNFVTNISLQPEGLLKVYDYHAMNNPKLETGRKTSFPITCVIEAYVAEAEDFEVTAVIEDNENSRRNLGLLKDQIQEICTERNINCVSFHTVVVSSSKQPSDLIENFLLIIDEIHDGDDIYADITFGTKPQTMILQTAIQYAYCVKQDTILQCVVYGDINRSAGDSAMWSGEIYDITSLLKLDHVIRRLADAKVADPRKTIEQIIRM